MKDYSKGKIYKIVSDSTDDIYIGSTIQTLSQRLAKHRSDLKEWKRGNHGYVTSYPLLERGDYHIILLEPFPCNNQEELTARERHYIDNNVCLNKVKPGRTQKEYQREYYQDNKDKLNVQMKEWRKNNKEYNKEYHKEYQKKTFQCLCDGEQHNLNNKTQHFKSQYHINNLKEICDIYGVNPSDL